MSTSSYVVNPYTGRINWECPSIGYPIPGGTELTNPLQDVGTGGPIAQAEPNGLFSPPSALGTYVMCLNDDGTVSPAYIEDNVRTFAQPMTEVDGRLVPVAGKVPSIRIDPKQAGVTPAATPTPTQ